MGGMKTPVALSPRTCIEKVKGKGQGEHGDTDFLLFVLGIEEL